MQERIFALCQKFFDQSDRLTNWQEVTRFYVPIGIRKVSRFFKHQHHCLLCNVKTDLYQIIIMAKSEDSDGVCGKPKILTAQEFGRNLHQEEIVDLCFGICPNGHGYGELTTIGAHIHCLPHLHTFVTASS